MDRFLRSSRRTGTGTGSGARASTFAQKHVQFLLLFMIMAVAVGPAEALYGGYTADIQSYPHHASIEANFVPRFLCSGAILSPRVLVTAAYCLERYYNPRDLVVRVGSSRHQSGGQVHLVSTAIRHPKYSPAAFRGDFDVAVLQLKTAIKWNQNVHSVALPRWSYRPNYGATAFASSWGSSELGPVALQLRYAPFKVTRCSVLSNDSSTDPNPDHRDGYNTSATLNWGQKVCVSNYPFMGTCYRDEGAPLIEKGFVIGLATNRGWGLGCENGLGSVFVSLSTYDVRTFLDKYV